MKKSFGSAEACKDREVSPPVRPEAGTMAFKKGKAKFAALQGMLCAGSRNGAT